MISLLKINDSRMLAPSTALSTSTSISTHSAHANGAFDANYTASVDTRWECAE